MRNDRNDPVERLLAAAGEERFEEIKVECRRGTVKRIQYAYRTAAGRPFSCVAKDLETARRLRNAWLSGKIWE